MSKLKPIWKCQALPLAHQQIQFSIDAVECTRWHWGDDAPRPFFWPLNGPHGVSLTRMGHPGAPNHDHHRSLWFAHHDVLGIDFWSDQTPAVIRQSQWFVLEDGANQATGAWELHWLDGHDPSPLLKQTVIATLRPEPEVAGWSLELQSDFLTPSEGVAFRQSNFGILGLRVARSLSRVFGTGTITGADGGVNEAALFGRPNRWIDYSGAIGMEDDRQVVEGIAVVDHCDNPGHGTDTWASWHVRDDGWFGPSLSRHGDVPLLPNTPLRCRYLVVVHDGRCPVDGLNAIADRFDASSTRRVIKSKKPHHQFEIVSDD